MTLVYRSTIIPKVQGTCGHAGFAKGSGLTILNPGLGFRVLSPKHNVLGSTGLPRAYCTGY